MNCHICRKDIGRDYTKYICEITGINYQIFVHKGVCDKSFRDKTLLPFKDPITSRFDILDIR